MIVLPAEDSAGVSAYIGLIRDKCSVNPLSAPRRKRWVDIVFPGNPAKYTGGMRVYAGRVLSEDEAIERARAILKERGGGAKAVEVIDWGRPNDKVVRRIDRDDSPVR